MKQAARDVGIQLIEVLCQLATTFKIQRPLQTHHNAPCSRQGFGLFFDGIVLNVACGGGQAFQQTVKKHLDQLDVVSGGYACHDLNRSVALSKF